MTSLLIAAVAQAPATLDGRGACLDAPAIGVSVTTRPTVRPERGTAFAPH